MMRKLNHLLNHRLAMRLQYVFWFMLSFKLCTDLNNEFYCAFSYSHTPPTSLISPHPSQHKFLKNTPENIFNEELFRCAAEMLDEDAFIHHVFVATLLSFKANSRNIFFGDDSFFDALPDSMTYKTLSKTQKCQVFLNLKLKMQSPEFEQPIRETMCNVVQKLRDCGFYVSEGDTKGISQ